MKIGIDAHMLGHNETGNETYVLELVRALAAQPSDDTLYIYVEQPDRVPPEIFAASHCRVIVYATRSSVRRLAHELAARAAHDALDVLHVSYNAPLRMPRACALVVTIHDISFETHPEWFPTRLRWLLQWSVPRSARAAHAVLTLSEYCREHLVRRYALARERVAVTPLAAGAQFRRITDRAALAAVRAKYRTGEKFILAVGNLQPRKNLQRLMSAFAAARARGGLEHTLVLVGQPLWLTGEILAQAQALGDAVRLTGYVADADLPLLYNAAEMFCYPSLYEGFGLPVVEAMACGTPVITSNVTALPDVAADAAYLVNPYDVDALAEALLRVARDASLQGELRTRGLARAQTFSWARTAEWTRAVYQNAARDLHNRGK